MLQSVKLRKTLLYIAKAVLLAQPLFTFPIFLSVLQVGIPLWLAWLIALIPWPLRFIVTGRLTSRTPFDIPIIISIAGVLLGFYLSPDRQLALSLLHTYLACVLFYYGIVNNNRAQLPYWLFWAGFLFLILLTLAVWVFKSGIGKVVIFNSWIYSLSSSISSPISVKPHSNALANACAVVIPVLLSVVIFRQRAWIKWSAGILALILIGALVLSASGGGWIATVVGILMILLVRNRKVFWSSLVTLMVAVAATYPAWSDASWIGVVFPIESLTSRLDLWQVTLFAMKDSLLTGLGLGGWWSKVPTNVVEGGQHDAYLQLYSDSGILGILALIIAGIICTRLIWQILHSDKHNPVYGVATGIATGIICGGICAILEANTNVLIPAGKEYLYFAVPFLWLWAALLVICHQGLLAHDHNSGSRRIRLYTPPSFLLWL
jgi:O-antigen ligase